MKGVTILPALKDYKKLSYRKQSARLLHNIEIRVLN